MADFLSPKHEEAVRTWFDNASDSEKLDVYLELTQDHSALVEELDEQLDSVLDDIVASLLDKDEKQAKELYLGAWKDAKESFVGNLEVDDFSDYLAENFTPEEDVDE